MSNTGIKVGLFLAVPIFLSTSPVQALTKQQLALTEDPFHHQAVVSIPKVEEKEKEKTTQASQQEQKPVKKESDPLPPQPIQYTVAAGDTLTSVAEKHTTTWEKLFAKNTTLSNPDIVPVGEVLTIPLPEEQLTERPLPQPVEQPLTSLSRNSAASAPSFMRGSTAGNTYAPGYCTWYAKSRRPDLPNRLGNASAWVASAAAQGFATGSAPRAGAIGQQGNHVVYVESVNGDGTVTVSEMNYSGLYAISSRTVPASYFTYIY